MREINAILGLCEVFRRFNPYWVPSWKSTWTCLVQLGCVGFGCGCLGTVLGYVSIIAAKEAKVVIKLTLMFLGCQFTIFAKFGQEVRSRFLALCGAGVVLLLD